MAAQAILAGFNMAASAAPLFFGENNIFSGKAREATRELKKNLNSSQRMQLPTEYNEALQSRLQQANTGLPSSVLGLYNQQMGRGMASQLGALGGRRSALAGIGNIAQAGQDSALQLAGMQGNALQRNRMIADQALMQMGGLKYQEQLRKYQEAADFYGVQKAESNMATSSALSNLGQSLGTAMKTGAFNKTPGLGKGYTTPTLDEIMGIKG
jgi:hypothetical protein